MMPCQASIQNWRIEPAKQNPETTIHGMSPGKLRLPILVKATGNLPEEIKKYS